MIIDGKDFRYLIRDTRPTGGVLTFEAAEALYATLPPSEEEPVVIVYGSDLDTFRRIAPRIAWGSAVLLFDHLTDDPPEVIARANHLLWWDCPYPITPRGGRLWIKSASVGGGGYGTHQPYLVEAVKRTTGPVLELGSGEGSTVVLHDLCAAQGRMLVTVESDGEWLSKFSHLEAPLHKMVFLRDPATIPCLDNPRLVDDNDRWGVVFVDHAPGVTRKNAIMRARESAILVVVHDTEEASYGFEPALAHYKYRKDFRKHRPSTTIASQFEDVSSIRVP